MYTIPEGSRLHLPKLAAGHVARGPARLTASNPWENASVYEPEITGPNHGNLKGDLQWLAVALALNHLLRARRRPCNLR